MIATTGSISAPCYVLRTCDGCPSFQKSQNQPPVATAQRLRRRDGNARAANLPCASNVVTTKNGEKRSSTSTGNQILMGGPSSPSTHPTGAPNQHGLLIRARVSNWPPPFTVIVATPVSSRALERQALRFHAANCALVFAPRYRYYECRTCQIDFGSSQSLCAQCFDEESQEHISRHRFGTFVLVLENNCSDDADESLRNLLGCESCPESKPFRYLLLFPSKAAIRSHAVVVS